MSSASGELATALASPFQSSSGRRRYVADTGAGHHYTNFDDLSESERRSIRTVKVPHKLATSLGITSADKEVDEFQIEFLGSVRKAVILKDTPNILSIGRLVVDDGYAFWWPWGSSSPVLMDKDLNFV